MQALLSPLAGRLSDRIEPRTIASIGMGLCFVGVGLLNFLGAQTFIAYLLGCRAFLGIGFASLARGNAGE